MTSFDLVLLAALLFAGAVLRASVGQAGAIAFIAAMGIGGPLAATMRPTVLGLYVLAAAFSTWRCQSARKRHIQTHPVNRDAYRVTSRASCPAAASSRAVMAPVSVLIVVTMLTLLLQRRAR